MVNLLKWVSCFVVLILLLCSQVLFVDASTIQVVSGMNFRGTWSSSTPYNLNDVVVSGQIAYIALVANTNVAVSNAGTWANTVPLTALYDLNAGDFRQPNHTSDPASCSVGQVEFNTTGSVFKGCTATNTWTQFGSQGAAGGGVTVYSGPSLTLTGTLFFPIGGGATSSGSEANVDVEAPTAATITNFYVQMSAAPGVGASVAYTWRKAGADTSVTCTVSGGSATTCNDVTHSVNVSQGDLVDIKVVTTGTVTGTPTLVMATQFGTTGSNGTVNSGTSGQTAYYASTGTAVSGSTTLSYRTIGVTFDGGGSALSGTTTRCTQVNYQGTISEFSMISDVSGNATVKVQTVAYGSYTGPGSSSDISNGGETMTGAVKTQDSTLTGWTTSLSANTVVCFALSSPATITWLAANVRLTAN